MKKIFARVQQIIPNIPINLISVAFFSLILIGLSFALNIRSLGFYLDDWPQLYTLVVRGTEGIKTFFLYDDRPFSWWPDLLVYKLVGTNPIGWHIVNYLLRWATGLGIWGTFTQLWPKHKREIFWVVLLFSVYPLFQQMSVGLTFIAQWFCYALFFLSLFFMILAVKQEKKRKFYLIFSILINLINIVTYEGFVILELIRPLILWVALGHLPRKSKITSTLLIWLPFLVITILYSFWRVFLLENIRGLDPIVFQKLISEPKGTLIMVINNITKDFVYTIFSSWFPGIDPINIDFSKPYLLFGFLLFVLVAGCLLIGLLYERKRNQEFLFQPDSFSKETIGIGLLGIFLGCAPGWLILKSASNPNGFWNDRFALPAIWGAALLIIGLITYLIQSTRFRRELIIILLLSLAVRQNFMTINEFKWSTTWQDRLFSQLIWRIPYVEPKTTFLSDNEFFKKMGVWGTSFKINLIYPAVQEPPYVDYYFLTLYRYFPGKVESLKDGIEIKQSFLSHTYLSDSRNSLVIQWISNTPNCLWVLSSNDYYNPLISENTKQALTASNLGLIDSDRAISWPDTNLFGKENRNTWCYYYESADLARQRGNWEEVIRLYELSNEKDLAPSNGPELMPFIEAYARTGKANIASNLTALAKSLTPLMRDYICDNWNRIAFDIKSDSVFDKEYKILAEQDRCWEVK